MSPVRAVIALGANLGDREAALRSATDALGRLDGVWPVAASGLVSTPALTLDGVDETKPDYLNAVVVVDTTLDPEQLLDALGRIEDAHGRVRQERWGDRTLDLDLIVHGDTVQHTERLTLPHPRAHERAFVLVPWLQAHPDAALPGRGAVRDLLAGLHDDTTAVDAPSLLGDVRTDDASGAAASGGANPADAASVTTGGAR